MQCPYFAKVLRDIDNGKGCWQSQEIGIFERDKQLGSYVRNYHGDGEKTFSPFFQDGEWFALYSRNYTATRVMKLPSCEDVCGEEGDTFGFCPVEYYVPYGEEFQDEDCGPWKDKDGVEHPLGIKRSDINGKIGFVAGCIWGDDTSWKIQFLDLSRIKEGIFIRDDRFGYIELIRGMSLKDAISLDCYDNDDEEWPYVEIACAKRFKVWEDSKNIKEGE